MKYKLSKFMHITKSGKDLILFHFLNGKVLCLENFVENFSNEKELLEILIENTRIVDKLVEESFLVPVEIDEWKMGMKKYFEVIMEPWLRLTILPTLQCNFRCVYCYEPHINSKLSEEHIEGIYQFVKGNINGKEGISVDWFGGEPLLEIDTIVCLSEKLMQLCKDRKILYRASMTTNGYLLNRSTFLLMRKCKINAFQITIDGPDHIHDKNRYLIGGGKTYEKIIYNLIDIQNNVRSASFNVIIRSNITKELLYVDLEEYISNLKKIFGNDNRFSFLFRPVGDWGGNAVKRIKNELINDINELYNQLLKYSKGINLTPHYYLLSDGMCQAGYRNSYVIMPNGKIGKCTMILDDDKNIIGEIIGKKIQINEQKHAVWLMPRYEQLMQCCQCKMFVSCCGAQCPASNLNGIGTCGYDFNNIDMTLKMLVNSQKEYKWLERVNTDNDI